MIYHTDLGDEILFDFDLGSYKVKLNDVDAEVSEELLNIKTYEMLSEILRTNIIFVENAIVKVKKNDGSITTKARIDCEIKIFTLNNQTVTFKIIDGILSVFYEGKALTLSSELKNISSVEEIRMYLSKGKFILNGNKLEFKDATQRLEGKCFLNSNVYRPVLKSNLSACGADGCSLQGCGSDKCSADVCGVEACVAEGCGVVGCVAEVCAADGCAAAVCATEGCGAEACAGQACALNVIPCPADAHAGPCIHAPFCPILL